MSTFSRTRRETRRLWSATNIFIEWATTPTISHLEKTEDETYTLLFIALNVYFKFWVFPLIVLAVMCCCQAFLPWLVCVSVCLFVRGSIGEDLFMYKTLCLDLCTICIHRLVCYQKLVPQYFCVYVKLCVNMYLYKEFCES